MPVPDFQADVTATDSYGDMTITQSPLPGTEVTPGEHAVRLTVIDRVGNPAVCDTTLTVREAQIFRVDPTATGTEDGLSWPTAFHAVQAGVDAAAAAFWGEVWVAGGTNDTPLLYSEERTEAWGSPASVPGSLVMKDGVSLYGGFEGYRGGAGMRESARSQRNRHQNVTVIDGRTARAGSAAYHVVVFGGGSAPTDGAILDGFTVIGGNAVGVADDYHTWRGGGVFNWQSKPIISNCIFTGNTAAVSGGAVANETNGANNAGAQFINCLFFGNSAGRAADTASNPIRGGGNVFNNMANASFTGCTITD